MTNEFKALMRLVGAAAQGTTISALPCELDWARIARLAEEQEVQSLLGYALRLSPTLDCLPELRKILLERMRQQAFSNHAWKHSTLQLLEKMNAEGIPVLLVKGYAVAECYAAPDCRMSGDADLLIEPKDEKRACAFMKSNGFTVERRWTNGHHDVCWHPQLGCVELHVRLYDEIVEDVWFDGMDGREFVCEPSIEVCTPDGGYCTLGYTDHMIFLMLHLIKHFILSGMALRMMLDVALFFSHNAERIDSARFWQTMQDLNYETIAQSILRAMVLYFGIDAASIPGLREVCSEQVNMIMDDLESGGWLGQIDKKSREEGWFEYNRQLLMKNRSKAQYLTFMLRWKKGIYLRALFPSREKLAIQYPCVQKSALIIPFVWLYRIVFRSWRAIKKGTLTTSIVTEKSKISSLGQKRGQMFKQLKIMK